MKCETLPNSSDFVIVFLCAHQELKSNDGAEKGERVGCYRLQLEQEVSALVSDWSVLVSTKFDAFNSIWTISVLIMARGKGGYKFGGCRQE